VSEKLTNARFSAGHGTIVKAALRHTLLHACAARRTAIRRWAATFRPATGHCSALRPLGLLLPCAECGGTDHQHVLKALGHKVARQQPRLLPQLAAAGRGGLQRAGVCLRRRRGRGRGQLRPPLHDAARLAQRAQLHGCDRCARRLHVCVRLLQRAPQRGGVCGRRLCRLRRLLPRLLQATAHYTGPYTASPLHRPLHCITSHTPQQPWLLATHDNCK
jgi:hypothetical protein